MSRKKIMVFSLGVGLLLVVVSAFLITATPVKAQCGSQASSCKNCHETQAQDPVNNDGTAWHAQHAFGDFCYLCHGGNNQATDKTAAHVGLVAPLSDIKTSCTSCHPTDATTKAQIYATTLGVQLGAAAPSSNQPTTTADTTTPAAAAQPVSSPAASSLPVDSASLVDYVQQYNQTVLGQAVNWGDIILAVLAVALLLGGGGFVILNEKLVKVTFGDTRKVSDEYPSDVVDLLPAINGLKPRARKSLKKILDKPEKTDKVLDLIDEVISDSKTEE